MKRRRIGWESRIEGGCIDRKQSCFGVAERVCLVGDAVGQTVYNLRLML
jgi:hypothetical protein